MINYQIPLAIGICLGGILFYFIYHGVNFTVSTIIVVVIISLILYITGKIKVIII